MMSTLLILYWGTQDRQCCWAEHTASDFMDQTSTGNEILFFLFDKTKLEMILKPIIFITRK